MKILHTSDWHLGIHLHKHSLIEDQRYFLRQLKNIILAENVDVIVISGDIYDTTLASKEAIDVFDEAMKLLCMELHKQVILIAGNHDSHTRLSVLKDLLKGAGLHVFGKIEQRITPLTIQDVDFFPVPYYNVETVAQVYEEKLSSYEAAMQIMMEDVRSQKGKHKQVVLAHCFVNGASLCESDRFAMIGGSDLISKDVFRDIDYVALGHLHRMQKVTDQIVYCGSPIAYSFSETGDKQVMILDSDTMESKSIMIKPLHPIQVIKGSYEEVLERLPNDQDAYVKIVLDAMQVSYEILDFFRERAPFLLSLQGTSKEMEEASSTIDVEEMEMMRDEDIVKHFFQDRFQKEITEEEMEWLREAKQEVEG